MFSYESITRIIDSAPKAQSPNVRDILWLSDALVVGISRNHLAQLEIFLRGAQLVPQSRVVDGALEFRAWHRKDMSDIEANRLVLPGLGHFDQVASFLCTEMLREGADKELPRSFKAVEPLIELSIERMRMTEAVRVGLAGELLFLDALCRRAQLGQIQEIVDSWHGWRRSSRDFHLGSAGVEVKTTRANSSAHFVEGVHQLQKKVGDAKPIEDSIHLVSIGIQPAEGGGNAFTIPQLVNRIVKRMEDAGCGAAAGKLLFRIAEYGDGEGYDHNTMASEPTFEAAFSMSFVRAYDLADDAVKVLRSDDISRHQHVELDSVKFRISLPASLGPKNPVVGLSQVADLILQAA